MAKLPFPFELKQCESKGEQRLTIEVKSTAHLIAWVIFCHPNWIIAAAWTALKDRVWPEKKK